MSEDTWTPRPGEYERLRSEDPGFPVVLAKAKAKGRGQDYNPKRHDPHEIETRPPKQQRAEAAKKADGSLDDALAAVMERFQAKPGAHPMRENLRKDLA